MPMSECGALFVCLGAQSTLWAMLPLFEYLNAIGSASIAASVALARGNILSASDLALLVAVVLSRTRTTDKKFFNQ